MRACLRQGVRRKTTEMEHIRTFIYSADQPTRQQLLALVEQCPLLEYAGVASAAAEVPATAPQGLGLLLLDVGAGTGDGPAFMGSVWEAAPTVLLADSPLQAVDAFTRGAVDFLLKPVEVSRFHKAVLRAAKGVPWRPGPSQLQDELDSLELKTGKGVVHVTVDDIHLVQSMGNYVKIHLSGGNVLATATMADMEQHLPMSRFVRIHRSYIVALPQVRSIGPRSIGCKGRELPLGGFYRRNALERITSFLHS
jgi:DNA-binding LytR/AlgR family response regulator